MDYKKLANHSRVWIYQSNRELTNEEVREIKKAGDQFIADWAAHGAKLEAAFEVFYYRFLVLMADESQVKASGCSIDSSVHFIKAIEQEYRLDLFDRLIITYKEDDKIKSLRLNEFELALNKGTLNAETIVFNNLIENKADFMSRWEVAVKDSWHKQLLTKVS